jgi:hypothetical protein
MENTYASYFIDIAKKLSVGVDTRNKTDCKGLASSVSVEGGIVQGAIRTISKLKYPLYHISTRLIPEEIWTPMAPEGGRYKSPITEPSIARISCSTTIEGCFTGIFPNISDLFERDELPYIDFYIYEAVIGKSARIIFPKELTEFKYVHDAHITKEHYLLDKTQMLLVGKVRVKNTNDLPTTTYHPFGDRSRKKHTTVLLPSGYVETLDMN